MSFKAVFDAKKLYLALDSLKDFRDKKGLIPSMECFLLETIPEGIVFMLGEHSFTQLREILPLESIAILRGLDGKFFNDRDEFIQAITKIVKDIPVDDVIACCERVVRISATDTYIGGFRYIPAIILEYGSFLVHYKMLDLLKEMGTIDIRIEEQPETFFAHVFYKKTIYKIPGMNPKDFQENIHIPAEGLKQFTIYGPDFFETLKAETPYKCTSEIRLAMNGVSIRSYGDDGVSMAVADYNRLIVKNNLTTLFVADKADVTLSNELVTAIRGESSLEYVHLYKDDVFVYVHNNNAIFFSRTYQDIAFVDYKGRILNNLNRENMIKVVVNIHELTGILKRIKSISSVTFASKIIAENNTLTIATASSEFGQGDEVIDVFLPENTECTVGVNAQMLLEHIGLLEQSRDVVLYLPQENNMPILIESEQEPNMIQFLQVLNV